MATSTPLYNLPIPAAGDPADAATNDSSMMGAVETAIKGPFVLKPTDQTVTSSTVFVPDTALLLAVVANATYEFSLDLIYAALAAGAISLTFTGPAGATATWTADGLASGVALPSGIINRQDNPLAGAVTLGSGATTATNVHAFPRGILKTAGTAGNLLLQWAQGTSSGTGTIVRAGSFLKIKRIA